MLFKLFLIIGVAICNIQVFSAHKLNSNTQSSEIGSNLITWSLGKNESTLGDGYDLSMGLNPVQESIVNQLKDIEYLTSSVLLSSLAVSKNDLDTCTLNKEQLVDIDESIKQSINDFSKDTKSQIDCQLIDRPSTCDELIPSILCALEHSEYAINHVLDEYSNEGKKWKDAFDKLLGNVERQISEVKRTVIQENALIIDDLQKKLSAVKNHINRLYNLLSETSKKLLNFDIRDGNYEDAIEQISIISESTHSSEQEVVVIGIALAYQLHLEKRNKDGFGDRLEINALIRNIFRFIDALKTCEVKTEAIKSLRAAMIQHGHLDLERKLVLMDVYKMVDCFADEKLYLTMEENLNSALSNVTSLLQNEKDHKTLLQILNRMEYCAQYLNGHWSKIIEDVLSNDINNNIASLAKFINNPSLKCPNQISRIIYNTLNLTKEKVGLWNSDVFYIARRIILELKNKIFLDSGAENMILLEQLAKPIVPWEFIAIHKGNNCRMFSEAGNIYTWQPGTYSHPFLYSAEGDVDGKIWWYFIPENDGKSFSIRNYENSCRIKDPDDRDVHTECHWINDPQPDDSIWLIKPVKRDRVRIQNKKSGKFLSAFRSRRYNDRVVSLTDQEHYNSDTIEQNLNIKCWTD